MFATEKDYWDYAEMRLKRSREIRDKEALELRIAETFSPEKSIRQISEETECPPTTVRDYLKKLGLRTWRQRKNKAKNQADQGDNKGDRK